MSILHPRDGETGLYLDGFLECSKEAVANQREVRWQISRTNSFPAVAPALVYDTLLTEPDGVLVFVDSVLIPLDRVGECGTVYYSRGAQRGATYYVSYMTRTTGNVESAWATAVSIVMGSARCEAATWAAGQ